MAGTLVVPVVDEGLGNSAYLVDLGQGRALAIDAPRDLRAVRAAASRYGLNPAFAADTHLHADFLSGPGSWPPMTARRSWLHDNLAGTLAGGLPAWQAAGNPVAATPLMAPGRVNPAAVVDVRQGGEYAGGHLPGALNIELGALARQAATVAGQPVVTMCGHGERAATAASVLERAGHAGVAILTGGPPEWSAATGVALACGA